MKALEYYDTCLTKFPASFDAAYNKCRLEFHIYQLFYTRSILSDTSASSSQNVSPFSEIMRSSRQDRVAVQTKILQDHEYALNLAQQRRRPLPNNTPTYNEDEAPTSETQEMSAEGEQLLPPSDLLYNMAQVQLSIAEEQYTAAPYSAALETFERAWIAQEAELESLRNDLSAVNSDSASENMDDDSGNGETEEYATVIEPTTYASLLETATAQISCLIPIYTISMSLSPSATAGPQEDAEELAARGSVFIQRIATLLANSEQLGINEIKNAEVISDAALTVMRYVAVSGYPFSVPECRPSGNFSRLQAVWSPQTQTEPDLFALDAAMTQLSTQGLVSERVITLRQILNLAPASSERYLAQSEMFTQFGLLAAVYAVANEIGVGEQSEHGAIAWSSLSLASQFLATALNALIQQNPESVVVGASMTLKSRLSQVRIWTTRGDVDLMRSNLSAVSATANKNSAILRKNAEIYYKNAVKLASASAKNDPEMQDAAGEAGVKCALVTGDSAGVVGYARWRQVVAEAIEDAVFSEDAVRAVVGEY